MPRFRAVITDADYPDVPQERAILQAIDAELVWEKLRTEDELISGLTGADVILTQYARLTARVVETLDRCRGIVRYGVGYDTVDLDAATRKGIYDSPLLGLENCVVTPHAAWYSDESSAALQRLAGEEAARLLLGELPRCPVNRLPG